MVTKNYRLTSDYTSQRYPYPLTPVFDGSMKSRMTSDLPFAEDGRDGPQEFDKLARDQAAFQSKKISDG